MILLLVGSCTDSAREPNAVSTAPTAATVAMAGEVLVGAGDIADCTTNADSLTASILDTIPGTVFAAGDNAYPNGTSSDYANCYEPTWGRHKARTRPVPGNHEYNTSGAAGYFNYFGAAAGDPTKGYYSYDLGSWHIIALNSNIAHSAGSPQEQWLRADLAAHPARCTLAYWHHPLFSSSTVAPDAAAGALWQALYEAGAELVLNGHHHDYERFAPQTPAGALDPTFGVREFVVGTGGGEGLFPFGMSAPNSEVRNNQAFGFGERHLPRCSVRPAARESRSDRRSRRSVLRRRGRGRELRRQRLVRSRRRRVDLRLDVRRWHHRHGR